MNKPDPKTIESLKQEHTELHLLNLDVGDDKLFAICRQTTRPEWLRFQASLADEGKRKYAFEQLLKDATVWPAADELDLLLEKFPGMAQSFGSKLAKICGAGMEADAKKL